MKLMFNFPEYEAGITLVMNPSRFLHLSRRHIWQGWWFETTNDSWPELVTWSAKKKSSDSLHWTHGFDLDFVCLKLVDSNWATWSSKKRCHKGSYQSRRTRSDTKKNVRLLSEEEGLKNVEVARRRPRKKREETDQHLLSSFPLLIHHSCAFLLFKTFS